jgi:hypothetical protein
VSPILGIYASQISGHLFNPVGSYDSISTVTVGAGGAASVTFSSIPSGYTHLQVRGMAQTTRATYGRELLTLAINGDTGSNYAWHELVGDGSVANASAGASASIISKIAEVGTTTGGTYGVFVCDILDYTNNAKYKTVRSLFGNDHNGTISGFGGTLGLDSGLWMNTTAVTSLTFSSGNTLTQYSQFALYGIKGA